MEIFSSTFLSYYLYEVCIQNLSCIHSTFKDLLEYWSCSCHMAHLSDTSLATKQAHTYNIILIVAWTQDGRDTHKKEEWVWPEGLPLFCTKQGEHSIHTWAMVQPLHTYVVVLVSNVSKTEYDTLPILLVQVIHLLIV